MHHHGVKLSMAFPAGFQLLLVIMSIAILSFALIPAASAQTVRPSDCITSTAAGDHTFNCEKMPVYVHIPSVCPKGGCGLILEIHGDGGTGPTQDAHLRLSELGEKAGYILIAPTGDGFPPMDDT